MERLQRPSEFVGHFLGARRPPEPVFESPHRLTRLAQPRSQGAAKRFGRSQRIEHRALDAACGMAVEGHAVALVEAADGVVQADQPGLHRIVEFDRCCAHARSRAASASPDPREPPSCEQARR